MADEKNLPSVPADDVKKFDKLKGKAKVTDLIHPGVVSAKFEGAEIAVAVPINLPAPKVGSEIEIEADLSGSEIVRYLHKPVIK